MIYEKPANYTKDMKATVAKPSPRGDGHDVIEVEPKDAEGNQLFIRENPGVVTVNGNLLAEQKTNSDAVNNVLTFSENISTIEIYHEEPTWQTFIVNGLNVKVPAGGYRTPIGGTPSKVVIIPAINCIVGRLV